MDQLPHIKLVGPDDIYPYTTANGGPRVNKFPERDRRAHGEYIKRKLETSWQESENEFATVHSERHGVYLEFQSSPGFELAIKSLEDLRKGIRLCNVREERLSNPEEPDSGVTTTYATVYIPNEKRAAFFDKIEAYLDKEKDSAAGTPRNAKLIEGVEELRKALLIESFWTDDKELIPDEERQWCEIWLRSGAEGGVIERFEQLLASKDISGKLGHIQFPERAVKLVHVSEQQLETITRFSDDIAEFRRAKDTARDLLEQAPSEQAEWVEDLIDRLSVDEESSVSVCILDTGINNGHPLLIPVLSSRDCQCVIPAWGDHDHEGHGTLMAGLSAYGDLRDRLGSSDAVHFQHRLESVKILPPTEQNDPELWGDITGQAISLAEVQAPERKRVTCMAITSDDSRDRGRPTSWSGAVDQIASGADGSEQRLLIVAAGNITDGNQIANYPHSQLTDSIHDPGQSWNALTVGAFTQLTEISDPDLAGYTPVASENQLSPFSTTSLIWEDKWPIKPEVVFEGGNVATDSNNFATQCDDLSLVSTFYKPQERSLESFAMTSAATAQAAHFAAQILVQYPDYWPETIRALMVHSARWPNELKRQFSSNNSKTELKKVLRCCGYGVPDIEQALYCAANSLTLVAEAEIQPFEKEGSSYRTKDMHLYRLPWPREVLQDLGEAEVEMRVTLSYFVEPGPGEIGWKDRYRYASHAFRFDLNSSTESEDEFKRRINRAARDEENGKPGTSSPSDRWVLGSQARDKGSIHSDVWRGTASDLAASNLIAISPTIGWWRERHHLGKYNKRTRYSLIVSITTPEVDVDI